MLKGIDACFFDMDGTIIDSMWMWRDIDISFLSERNIPMPEDLQQQIEGKSFSETAVYFKERFNLIEPLDEIKKIWNDMAMYKYCNEVPLKNGFRDFLNKLKAMDIKTGIATSNSYELASSCLKALGVFDEFDTIVTSCHVGCGKPAPDVYLKCASDCGVSPDKCLVFEDILVGIEAGHRAGMKVCAVYDEYSKDVDMEKRNTAEYYIRDFMEVI